jgi:hypothetical protein
LTSQKTKSDAEKDPLLDKNKKTKQKNFFNKINATYGIAINRLPAEFKVNFPQNL